MFKCENPDCNNEHNGSYASGRFCCEKCRRHYASLYAAKTKRKNGTLKCNFNASKENNCRSPYGTWKCKYCGLIFKTRNELQQHIWNNHREKYGPHGKGQTVWNKGLTANTDYRIQKVINTLKNNYKLGKIIPSFKNKKHSLETREKISKARSKILDSVHAGFQDIGWYKVKNLNGIEYTVRGHWEENVALRVKSLGISWEKNKWLTYFDGEINRQYNPDFYIPKQNLYIEVKGYFSDKDKLKMKFVLDQNNVKIYFIGSDKYQKFIDGQIEFNDNLVYKN